MFKIQHSKRHMRISKIMKILVDMTSSIDIMTSSINIMIKYNDKDYGLDSLNK